MGKRWGGECSLSVVSESHSVTDEEHTDAATAAAAAKHSPGRGSRAGRGKAGGPLTEVFHERVVRMPLGAAVFLGLVSSACSLLIEDVTMFPPPETFSQAASCMFDEGMPSVAYEIMEPPPPFPL